MYITTIRFKRALEWFLHSQYKYMLLYASGSDRTDYEMVEDFLKHKDVIDRQIGGMVCFLHFIENTEIQDNSTASIIQAEHKASNEDFMLYHIKSETAKELTRKQLYYGVGLEATYETTDEMCSFLGIERYKLPAFVLFYKNQNIKTISAFANQYSIFTIKNKKDFESLLIPIKLANEFKMDLNSISRKIENVKAEPKVIELKQGIEAIKKEIEKLQIGTKEELKSNLLTILAEINISFKENGIPIILELVRPYMIKKKLSGIGMVKEYMKQHNDLYYKYKSLFYKIEKWDKREADAINNLKKELERKETLLGISQTRESRLSKLESDLGYIKELYRKKFEEKLLMTDSSSLVNAIICNSPTLPMILENTIKTFIDREALVRSIIDDVKRKVKDLQFNVFISCKSEDYELGEDVYAFLRSKGYKPFIASKSLREIGNDIYSAAISDVIDVCQHMIVFASDLLYVETPYVKSEWNMFCNEVKAGRKKGKLITLLQDSKQGEKLPIDLRSREVLTISTFKESICNYLS